MKRKMKRTNEPGSLATLPPEQWVEPTPEKMLEVFGMAWDYFVPEREPAKRLTDDALAELLGTSRQWKQLPLFPPPRRKNKT